MKRIQQLFLVFLLVYLTISTFSLEAQIYPDHFGTGNDVGVTVTSSSEEGADKAINALNGTGNFPDLAGASRFLGQAGFGATMEEIEYVAQIGIDAWIEEQINLPYLSYLEKYNEIYSQISESILEVHPGEPVKRERDYNSFAFYEKTARDKDVLRNKAAFALSQILVVSTGSISLNVRGFGGADYYDVLYKGAFGNYRELLSEVTLHLAMGYYLSHWRNQKGDPALGTLPDENYAREVMQLFTIGLHELNIDGTPKLDENGNTIPTYDITDVQELAKVFTGLSGGAWDLEFNPNNAGQPLRFNRSLNNFDMTVPMIMYETHHEQGEKIMVDDTVIPAGQEGMKDIEDALDVLFNHPNVGPFVAFRLIQQLVKSNPTPAYVKRVALAFNNNGQGIRGDMKAVFSAVLKDPEARDCAWVEHPKNGKLRQPIERIVNLFRAFNIDSPSGKLWLKDSPSLPNLVEQAFMNAPSVFNFFSPIYAEDSFVKPNNMVSPEFQILHAVTTIHYLNLMEDGITIRPFQNRTRVHPNRPNMAGNNQDNPFLDFTQEISTYENEGVDELLNRLNLLICHGQLSEGSHEIIKDALVQLINSGENFESMEIVQAALYFIFASPDYMILK